MQLIWTNGDFGNMRYATTQPTLKHNQSHNQHFKHNQSHYHHYCYPNSVVVCSVVVPWSFRSTIQTTTTATCCVVVWHLIKQHNKTHSLVLQSNTQVVCLCINNNKGKLAEASELFSGDCRHLVGVPSGDHRHVVGVPALHRSFVWNWRQKLIKQEDSWWKVCLQCCCVVSDVL